MAVTTKVFPTAMMVMSVAASAVYAFDGNWRRSVYWFAAAVLNYTVTY